ncbi:MAG: phosphate ABC transporter substrate-binding protein PstS, partial [Candidatus Saccharimonadales bacterium]
MKKLIAVFAGVLMCSVALADSGLINGAGSSFIYPACTKWFEAYSSVKPDVRFNYQSIGSGGGI